MKSLQKLLKQFQSWGAEDAQLYLVVVVAKFVGMGIARKSQNSGK